MKCRTYKYPYLFIIIIKLNKKKLPILLQDKYNIGVLTVNIEFMWLGDNGNPIDISIVVLVRGVAWYIY
jgi:hypothetical protein